SILREGSGEGPNEDVRAFLGMNAAQADGDPFAAKRGKAAEEFFAGLREIERRTEGAVRNNHLAHAIARERFPREQALFFGGKEDSGRIAEDAGEACMPVEGFLDVLERELALEVWVHHAVGEDGP